jgi:ATP-dependent DNA ligase
MLADKCADADEFEQYVTFPCQGDVKYDGERNIAIVKSVHGKVEVSNISRSGLEAFHMNGLFDSELAEIHAYVKEKFGWDDFILDGERFANDWTDTMNAKKSGLEGEDAKSRMFIRAFFMMPLKDWLAQKTLITMRQNRVNIEQILSDLPHITRITLSTGREVKDYQDMTAFCDEVTTPGYDGQAKGHEGLILKEWEATYSWDRSMAWCKVKKFYDVDMKIVGFLPGRPKSKFEKTLGKLTVIGVIEEGSMKGTFIKCNVGSGIKTLKPKDDDSVPTRDEIWNSQAKFLGGTVVVKYQEITLAKGKTVHSLRFGTVSRFRDDKIIEVEDITEGADA